MGAAAGAVGTIALNTATYADMALRARSGSSVPDEVAGRLAERAGVDLGDEQTAANRKAGLGALMGYVNGVGVGAAYGVVRPLAGRKVSVPWAAVGLTLASTAGTDAPIAATGVSNPATWPASSWAMDLGFHLAYGLATAAAYEAFAGEL
jgi:hypothetical protein